MDEGDGGSWEERDIKRRALIRKMPVQTGLFSRVHAAIIPARMPELNR
jgi:hypothetical protein